jgi:adenylyl- and sulfurtransferase ThiI
MFKAFLIKYAEIGLKGNNRYIFENALRDRIKEALSPLEVPAVLYGQQERAEYSSSA